MVQEISIYQNVGRVIPRYEFSQNADTSMEMFLLWDTDIIPMCALPLAVTSAHADFDETSCLLTRVIEQALKNERVKHDNRTYLFSFFENFCLIGNC